MGPDYNSGIAETIDIQKKIDEIFGEAEKEVMLTTEQV
jgi:hypothetical protein